MTHYRWIIRGEHMNNIETLSFAEEIKQGIPEALPLQPLEENDAVNHAPKRPQVLRPREERLALANALRYFPEHLHSTLAPEKRRASHTATDVGVRSRTA